MSIFVENLKKLIKERGITQKKFLTDLGLNINAIGDWQKNGNVPKGDTLQRIANYFSVSVDYLLGKSEIAIDDSVLDLVDRIDQDILEIAGSDLNIALKWQSDRDHLSAQLEASRIVNKLSYEEHDLIDIYRQLPDHSRTKVLFTAKQELFAKWHDDSQKKESRPSILIKKHQNKAAAGFGYNLSDSDEWMEIEVYKTDETSKADFAVQVDGDSMEPDFHDGDIALIKFDPDVPVGEVGLFVLDGMGYIKERGKKKLISRNKDYPDIEGEARCIGLVIGIAEQV